MISKFLESVGFSYQKTGKKDYALDHTIIYEDLDLNLTEKELDEVSCKLANVIDLHQQKVKQDPALIEALCYPNSIVDLTRHLSPLVAMRLSYVVDVSGTPKLIETNAQTPSFWWECEDGTDAVLNYFKKTMRNPKYLANLSNSIRYGLSESAKTIGKSLNKIRVGLITCDSLEDIYQMQFIKDKIQALNCVQEVELITIDRMDINKANQVFSLNTQNVFDVIFMWYPMEWLATEEFADGTPVIDCLQSAVNSRQVAIFNGIDSFLAQNKNLFAYITEFWDELETAKLDNYFVDTYYTLNDLVKAYDGDENQPYIAKPIFGREGQGIFGKTKLMILKAT